MDFYSILKYDPNQPREPKGSPIGGQFASKNVTATQAFKNWFGNSKVMNADGSPKVVYHGTLNDFNAFSPRFTNPKAFFGKGYYFTGSSVDASENYARLEGPDQKAKLDDLVDQFQFDLGRDGDPLEDPPKEVEPDEIRAVDPTSTPSPHDRARARLGMSHQGVVLPVFLKMERPLHVGGNRDTYFEYGDEGSTLEKFIQNFRYEAKGFDVDVEPFLEELQSEALEEGGIRASTLLNMARNHSDLSYAYDHEGNLAVGELLRRTIERAGFDGIIDREAKRFRGMQGVDQNTTHYIVFKPTQIKSAIGNTTFDPSEPRIVKHASKQ